MQGSNVGENLNLFWRENLCFKNIFGSYTLPWFGYDPYILKVWFLILLVLLV